MCISGNQEIPPELEDAKARIEQAKENYISLAEELEKFLYDYVKGMIKGFDKESENFVMQLRHPKESNIRAGQGFWCHKLQKTCAPLSTI